MSRSTTSRLMPLAPGASGSVRATTITRSALIPLVMNVFEPLSTQPSPSLRAVVRMPCRSLPAPGSVIAIAVISSPLQKPGQPALLLLLGGQIAQVGADDVVVQPEADPARADPGQLLVEDGVVAEVAHAAAAEPLVHVHAEQALRATGEPDLARHDAVLLPLVVERRDVLLRPGPHHLAELVVLGLVQGVAHGGQSAAAGASRIRRRADAGPSGLSYPRGHLSTCRHLDRFSAPTRAWFTGAFVQPTAAQEGAWDAVTGGEHALVVAPTGSGKTLAAFLWSLDRLAAAPPADERSRCRVLYVSPLKALAVDVERNLRAPLAGIGQACARLGLPRPDIRVGIRSGDTPADERRALARRPPDILITTPESLFLLLTSSAREALRGVETVIVDEVHAVAGTQARRAPGGLARPPRRAARAARPADRAVGHRAAGRGGGHLPRRRPPGARGRPRGAQGVGPLRRRPGRGHERAGRSRPASSPARRPAGRAADVDLARGRGAGARPGRRRTAARSSSPTRAASPNGSPAGSTSWPTSGRPARRYRRARTRRR